MIEVHQGRGPVVLGLPRTGTELVENLGDKLNDRGRAVAETDWNIHSFYSGLLDRVTTVRTPVQHYVIDVSRGGDDASL
jgi:formiminoglutamase